MTTVLSLWQTPAHSPEFKNSMERYNQGKKDFTETLKQTQKIFKSILFNRWLYADQKKNVQGQNQAFGGFTKSWKSLIKVIDNSLLNHDCDAEYHKGYEDLFRSIRLLQIQHSAYLLRVNQLLLTLIEEPTNFDSNEYQISKIQLEMAKLNVQFLQTIANPREI